MQTLSGKRWFVTQNDYIDFFKKIEGAGRENANFVFTGFSKFDRANPKMIESLLKAVQVAGDYAALETGKEMDHNLVARPLFFNINDFKLKFWHDANGVKLLEVPTTYVFGPGSMQRWAQFEALLKYALKVW